MIQETNSEQAALPHPQFAVGEVVCLRSDTSAVGAVIKVSPGMPECRYLILQGAQRVTWYESQIQLADEPAPLLPVLSPGELQSRLTAFQITQPGTSALYSLHAARVNFVPYQFRPVLKLIRAERPRLLIADEVGVGKTIESGLILRELQARQDMARVLVICPRPLITERKWQLELARFDEKFEPLDGPRLRHCLAETDRDGLWPDLYSKALLPFSLFNEELLYGAGQGRRRNPGLLDLDPPPRFDLVIVDEAHHLRNASTWAHQGVRFFCENAEAVVFLSATPIQLGDYDLYTLLNLLRPDWVTDYETFQRMSEPNPALNRAIAAARSAEENWQGAARDALGEAAATEYGRITLTARPDFTEALERLTSSTLEAGDRLALVRQMEEWHTFAPLINRTRRRDIGNFTTRKAESVEVEFTPPQQKLHDDLLAANERILRLAHGDIPVGFLMSTLRRQAASCLYGLAPFIREILGRHVDEAEWADAGLEPEMWNDGALASVRDQIQDVLRQADNLDRHDPKLNALLDLVREKAQMPNNNVLLFSSFRHTLRYLLRHLEEEGYRVGLVHGGVPDEERALLRNRFARDSEAEDALDILLSSEVGCEGLDYQFCDCLVNFDLPWNPMRVEQRIGRIDRYGQRSETVAIYNFITPGTVDHDIFERCHLRIGVFQQALGGSEEILGRITQQIRAIAEQLDLTPEERRLRLQQIADNDIRLMQEQARLEEQQAEFFGLTLPPEQLEEEVRQATSPWLQPSALRNLVRHYARRLGATGAPLLGEGNAKTLLLNQEARSAALEDFRRLARQNTPVAREWERWLKGTKPQLSVTFDAATAAAQRDITFLTPVHPLIQAAAASLAEGERPISTVCRVPHAAVPEVPPGRYTFALYAWTRKGLGDDASLQVICEEPSLQEHFWRVLEAGEPVSDESVEFQSRESERLEAMHYELWDTARREHREATARLAHARRQSLRFGNEARLALLRDQLAAATDEKIRRMRESQINSAQVDIARRQDRIDAAERAADIIARRIGLGVVTVYEGGEA